MKGGETLTEAKEDWELERKEGERFKFYKQYK
jgi:hypothetical protein